MDEMVDLAWRKRRIPAYETAMISKQRDETIRAWEVEHPLTLAFDQWSAKQAPQKPAEQPVDPMFGKILRTASVHLCNPTQKDVSGPRVKPVNPYIIQLAMHRLTLRELVDDEGVNSSALRGMVCCLALSMGVDVECVLGPRPESQSVVNCSPEEAQRVIDAACELNALPEIEFWDAIWEEAEHNMMNSANALAAFDQERTRVGDAAGLLNGDVLATLQRYEVQASNQFFKLLDRWEKHQEKRLCPRPIAPPEVKVDS